VQADPIRSPARAQDLILRHRVKSYRAGELEKHYPSLDIEEDVLYAYGFLPRSIWQLLHPRKTRGLSHLEKKVFNTVCKFGRMHPAELQSHFGSERVVNAWGGPDYHPGWPGRLQTIAVDRQKNVYLSGTTPGDSIIEFTRDGKFVRDFGHRGPKVPADQVKADNQQTATFPPGIGSFDLDEDAGEILIADGFLNKRILVYDLKTGAFKRGWGGKGIPLSEVDNNPTPNYDISGPPPDQAQFAPAIHCVHFSRDGLVYVCERGSDRVQVFTKQGKFVRQWFVHPSTQARGANCGGPWSTTAPPCGTVYHLALSADPQQRYVFVADGTNNMVWIYNRNDGTLAGSFGGNGRYAGQLHWIDAIAVDSKGNVYTGEVEDGKRIQKFVPVN